MKNLQIIGFLCLVGLLLFIPGLQKISGDAYKSEKPSEISSVISKFWRASLQGNGDALNQIITKIPDDYYAMYNKCKKSDDLYFGIDKAVTEQDSKYEYDGIFRISSGIKNNKRVHYKIVEERVSGNHAVTTVDFGETADMLIYHELFLMNKEKGEWKIFMISGSWYLSQTNKYFVQKDCSEKSVTEAFWLPVADN